MSLKRCEELEQQLSDANLKLREAEQQLSTQAVMLEKMFGVVRRLADWSRKYPKETVHSYNVERQCHEEMYAIEESAKQALEEYQTMKKGAEK